MSRLSQIYNRREYLRRVAGVTIATVGVSSLITPAAANPAKGAQESGKFQLENTAGIVREPGVRPVNHVVEVDTSDDGDYGSLGRYLDTTELPDLEGQLNLRANVVSGDTITSAPRVILSVDTDGDGEHDDWIFGFHQDLGAGIAGDGWTDIDFTDGGSRWNTNRIGGSGSYISWDQAKADWSSDYSLRTGWVVDDGFWDDDAAGVIHLDEVQIGSNVLEGPADTVGSTR